MDSLHEEEATPLISRSGIPTAVRDTRQPYEKQLAVYLILASTLFERIAFYTLAANLALNLETSKLKWTSTNGLIASFIFSGTSNVSTIIFAILSDAKLGRFKTIIVGFFLYLIGYILATLVITEEINDCLPRISNKTSDQYQTTIFHEQCSEWILSTLIIIAIGAGAVQSNMAVFGAEQIQESTITSRYFDKYVIVVNIGAIFAMVGTPFSTDNESIYHKLYIATASVLLIAALLFIIGWRYYLHIKPYDTVVTKCIPVVISAFQSWYKYKQTIRSIVKRQSNTSASKLLSVSHSLTEEESMRIGERPSTFLDFAKPPYNHGKFNDRMVDDVKSLRSAFIVFGLLIPYWLIYHQINSTFRIQTQHTPESQTKLAVIFVSLADPITIVVGILILIIFVYKYLDARNRPLTIVTRFVIGMCSAVLCMCIAGIVETIRKKKWEQVKDRVDFDLTIYAQLPQNIAMGLSELFGTVASFEFAFFAAPSSAQTLFMSLRFCSIGIASFIDATYIAVSATTVSDVTSDNPSYKETNSFFNMYFFTLAGLQFIFIIIFIICQRTFRIVALNPQQIKRNQFLQHSSASSSGRQ